MTTINMRSKFLDGTYSFTDGKYRLRYRGAYHEFADWVLEHVDGSSIAELINEIDPTDRETAYEAYTSFVVMVINCFKMNKTEQRVIWYLLYEVLWSRVPIDVLKTILDEDKPDELKEFLIKYKFTFSIVQW